MASPALHVFRAAGTTPPITSVLTTQSANDPPAFPISIFFNSAVATLNVGTAFGTVAFFVPMK